MNDTLSDDDRDIDIESDDVSIITSLVEMLIR